MRHNHETERVFEHEYDNGYEWKVIAYPDDILVVT